MQVWRHQNRGLEVQNRVLEGVWPPLGRLLAPRRLPDAFWRHLGRVLGRLGSLLVANMAQTRPPKWGQNPITICIKIWPIFDTSWKGYILRSWWIFDAKLEPNWLPNFDKFRYQLPKGHFLFGGIIPILKVYWFQNKIPTEAKIHPETGSERECLWKAFFMILWWILAPRMGPNIC